MMSAIGTKRTSNLCRPMFALASAVEYSGKYPCNSAVLMFALLTFLPYDLARLSGEPGLFLGATAIGKS